MSEKECGVLCFKTLDHTLIIFVLLPEGYHAQKLHDPSDVKKFISFFGPRPANVFLTLSEKEATEILTYVKELQSKRKM